MVIGDSNTIYFWQQAGFGNIADDLRHKLLAQAHERRAEARDLLQLVQSEGAADSENS